MSTKLSYLALIAPAAAICLFSSANAMAGNPMTNGWKQVAPNCGKFSVLMPGTPHESTKQIDTKAGPTVLHMYIYVSGSQAFSVIYNDYPTKLDVDLTLGGVRDGEVGKGRVLTDSNVTLNGNPGKRITAWVDGKLFVSEFYVAGARLYQVMYTSDPLHALLDAPLYLKSFQIDR